jgi:hypothetical protein
LSFSYWIDNLGFITEGKLASIFIKPSLGVSNWPVIYFINYTPISFLAPSSPRHQQVFWRCCRGLNYIFPRQLRASKTPSKGAASEVDQGGLTHRGRSHGLDHAASW